MTNTRMFLGTEVRLTGAETTYKGFTLTDVSYIDAAGNERAVVLVEGDGRQTLAASISLAKRWIDTDAAKAQRPTKKERHLQDDGTPKPAGKKGRSGTE